MFFGSPLDAIKFFDQFNMPNHVNPADFFLEKINVSYEKDIETKTMRLDEVANAWNNSPFKEVNSYCFSNFYYYFLYYTFIFIFYYRPHFL